MAAGARFGIDGGVVVLTAAKVDGILDMERSIFSITVNANYLNVSGLLYMGNNAIFENELWLGGARIGGNLNMAGSNFAKGFTAYALNVEGDLLMSNKTRLLGSVKLIGAKVKGSLSLQGATGWRIDLSGAEARELDLDGLGWWCLNGAAPVRAESGSEAQTLSAHWRLGDPTWRKMRCAATALVSPPALILRNAHFGDFQDSLDAWPPLLDLEGFHYERLGGVAGSAGDDMRERSPKEWSDWLARDPTFSTQPYTELSSVLAAAGRRDTADAIRLFGREWERTEACASWPRFDACAWLTFLSSVSGYGIGSYTFRVLRWVIGFTALGAVILWFSPNAQKNGPLWLIGASLHRLLPIIELSKEFTNFFESPYTNDNWPRNLNRLQEGYFALHAVAGWVLGLILLAAISGLTQNV
jgi:hypothetical protein